MHGTYTVIAVNENTFVIQALNTDWYLKPTIVKEEKKDFPLNGTSMAHSY